MQWENDWEKGNKIDMGNNVNDGDVQTIDTNNINNKNVCCASSSEYMCAFR